MAYQALSTVMGSTANGTVVPASYGDQVRDNQVALLQGFSFAATGAVSQATSNAAWTLISMNAVSLVNLTAAECVISSGYLLITRAGIWTFDGYAPGGPITIAAMSIGATTAQTTVDSHYSISAGQLTPSPLVKLTSTPAYISLWVFGSSNSNMSSSLVPRIFGQWRGNP